MVYGVRCIWNVVNLWWTVVDGGVWCMVYGVWCMVYGAWCMVYGVCWTCNVLDAICSRVDGWSAPSPTLVSCSKATIGSSTNLAIPVMTNTCVCSERLQ
jgi:hypothetical protein